MTIVPVLRPLLLISCLLLGSCAGVGRSTVNQPVGKVPILYLYGEADRQNPPAAFHVRRSTTFAGPFERINKSPIQGTSTANFASPTVIYTDTGLPVGSTWYYYLEVVDTKGNVRKATPVVTARVVLPSKEEKRPAKKPVAKEKAKK